MVENVINPVTLTQALRMMSPDWRTSVTNDFIYRKFFLRNIPFQSLINPTTGGSGITHQFTRLRTTAPISTRRVNQDYTPDNVDTLNERVDVKFWGGSYELDRILARMGTLVKEVLLQSKQYGESCANFFEQLCVIGDSSKNKDEFDGLLKIASAYGRVSTPKTPSGNDVDIYHTQSVKENFRDFIFAMNHWLSTFDQKPTFILANKQTINCLKQVANEVSLYTKTMDQWGNTVEYYDGIALIELGYKVQQKLIPGYTYKIDREEILPTNKDGTSCLIAGRFGFDAIYGICPESVGNVIQYWEPRFDGNNADPVQKGEVEMSGAMVVNRIESIGVLENITVDDERS